MPSLMREFVVKCCIWELRNCGPEEYHAILKRTNIIVFAEYGTYVWNAEQMFNDREDCLDHLMLSGTLLLARSCRRKSESHATSE